MTDTATKKAKPPRMQIFRKQDGKPLTEDQMRSEGLDDSVMTGFGKLRSSFEEAPAGKHVEVEQVRCLFSEDKDDGLSLTYAWFKSGFLLPRHSHDADCIYYVLGGELRMGTQVLRKGDGVFVPANMAYAYETGPEGVEVLEFRNATRFNILYKSGEHGHWDAMANIFRQRISIWEEETVPPSDRPRVAADAE